MSMSMKMKHRISQRAAAKAAKRGAALLDREEPGWWQGVNLTQLDVSNGDACVLGQVFRPQNEWQEAEYGFGYNRGAYLLGLEDGGLYRHGFQAYRCTYGQLDAAWTVEVEKRRAKDERKRPSKQAAEHLELIESIEARKAAEREHAVLREAAAVVNAVDPIRHYRSRRGVAR